MLLLSLLIAPQAQAGFIEAWSRDDFGEQIYMDGTDGWVAGYRSDAWWAEQGYAWSDRDDGGGVWGGGNALDNWIVRGETLQQQVVTATFRTDDDDTIGLVFCADAADSHYLVGYSSDQSPIGGMNGNSQVFLVRVEAGAATTMDRVGVTSIQTNDWQNDNDHTLRIVRNNTVIRVQLDGTEVINVTENNPLPAGQAGLYAYESGWNAQGNPRVTFNAITVQWIDDDDDGVVDDLDNCEFEPNPGQVDSNGNGIGDICEGGDADTDADADSDSDVDADADSDVDTDVIPDTAFDTQPVVGAKGCGCNKAPAGSGLLFLLLPALWLRRRI